MNVESDQDETNRYPMNNFHALVRILVQIGERFHEKRTRSFAENDR